MTATLNLTIEDFTGQVRRRARNIPRDATVSEFVSQVTQQLQLPEIDASGRPILYGARTSDSEALNASDRVGDVLVEEDVVTLTKTVTAGSMWSASRELDL